MPEYPEYYSSHALDINTLSEYSCFWAEYIAEIYVWQRFTRKVSEKVFDDILEKMSLQERVTYPEYVDEFPDHDKGNIMDMQWQPMRFIENMIYMAKELFGVFKHHYNHLEV